MRFNTVIFLSGKTATGMEVPTEVVEGLGSGKKPAVIVKIGDYSYRSTVAVYGGKFMLPLSAEHRQAAGVSAGEEVEVELELDLAPREVEMPEDLASGLAGDTAAEAFWAGLSYSNKRRIILSINDAKTPETRARRVAKAMEGLRNGKV
ncbi:YdeI/OmpD-associated family protein [Paenibacillus sp. CAU 1782]